MLDKIPTPPTDNLYKFLTAAGLLMLLAGAAGTTYLQAQYTDKRDGLSRELLNGARTRLQTERNELLAKVNKETLEAVARDEQLRQVMNELLDAPARREFDLAEREVGATWARVQRQIMYLWVVGFNGGMLLVFGMLKWYQLHQRHQDDAVRLDLEQKRHQNRLTELEVERRQIELSDLRGPAGPAAPEEATAPGGEPPRIAIPCNTVVAHAEPVRRPSLV